MPPPRFSLSNLSIKHRLPLLIGALLLGVIVASTWAAYRGIRESALEVGRERLLNLTQQLAGLSQQSAVNLTNKTFTAASDPAIKAFLSFPSDASRPGAVAILQQFAAPQDPNSLQVELWNAKHSLALAWPDGSSPQPADLRFEFDQSAAEPFKTAGAIRTVKDAVAFPLVAAVKGDAGTPIGYLVRWRRLGAPEARKQLTDLLGSHATLYFGNLQGEVWTDMVKVVPKPPAGLQSTLQVTHYLRDGNSVMALGRPINGTPWFIVVEFPDHVFLSQASRFFRRMSVTGLVLLAVGVAGAIALSRSITQPLRSLTKAATAISDGDYSRVVDIRQKDELGALASAFNVMVARVDDSQRELEGKVLEHELAEEAASKLAAIIESSKDCIIGKNLDGIITSWNDGARKLYGYTAEEAVGQSISLLVPPDRQNEIPLLLEKLVRGETINSYGTERITKAGKRIDVSLTTSPIKDKSGRLIGVSAIGRDITERKRAEEQLRLQSAALESAANAIMITDVKGKITWVNPAFSQTTGYSFEEAVGKNSRLLKSGKQDPAFYQEMWKTVLSGKVWRNTIINRCKDGTFYHADLTVTPIRNSAGKITHFVGIKQDITEKARAEETLQASEFRYRRLFESAKDGILILDGDSGRIVDANPYLVEMLRYSKEELMGKELSEIGFFKDVTASRFAFAELQKEGYIRYEDLPLQTRDGHVKQVEFVSASYLVGERRVLQCNIRDISDRKQGETALKEANQSLELALKELQEKSEELASMTQQLWQASKLATMGELAASVAHELNNPLATVALRAESTLEALPPGDPKRHALEVISQEVERMATLVSNLLLFSRRSHRQISTVDLREELTNSLDFIQYHLRSHKIDVVQDFAAVLPTVQADRQQLRQVFLNLLTNASDAMPEGGTLTVRSRGGATAGGQTAVVVEFSDTGIGVQKGDLQKLWEPFFTTKPEGKGTGLGLAICRRTVEEHRGTIEIETSPRKGTTVRITLPATDEGIGVAA